ncbi:hypothetical protein GOODEAATRI_023880 [Goodea atripinnis]|uniref:Uncharacterized protein n=1 Tax=Goodea atripinnis TaxID=208336 RepID=A0ABV0N585_9TELE
MSFVCWLPGSSRSDTLMSLLLQHLDNTKSEVKQQVNPRDRPSVSSVLQQPFLEKHISKHLNTQVGKKETTGKMQIARGTERPGAAGRKPFAKLDHGLPFRVNAPPFHKVTIKHLFIKKQPKQLQTEV